MFCPKNMTIIDVKDKYKKYVESLNVIITKIIFVNSGRRICDDDTIKKYSETSNYAIFIANFIFQPVVDVKIPVLETTLKTDDN